jgi:hypothetical protein
MSGRAVFLDLNGTPVDPQKQEPHDELTLIPGVAEAVARLTASGFDCPVVTVQSRLAKGERWLSALMFVLIASPSRTPARTERRPLRERGKRASVYGGRVLCDRRLPDDVLAARRLGARGCLVRTGWASDPRVVERALPDASIVADLVCPSGRLDIGFGLTSTVGLTSTLGVSSPIRTKSKLNLLEAYDHVSRPRRPSTEV